MSTSLALFDHHPPGARVAPPEETTLEQHYTPDNTDGYTPAELDVLNAALQDLLADLASSTDGQATEDDVQALITRHADDVARR